MEYDAPDLVPVVGDVVPCRRHGHCPVAQAVTGRTTRHGRRPAPRTEQELVEHLGTRGHCTVAALRRGRFSLRLVAGAERAGLVHLDLLTGRVWLPEAHGPGTATGA
ncbi:hypothetical protein ASG41_16375 [Modestobacter sp. Leaf380]|nr:hypothetical protein ASG41_16375 [Modestobacter sp. Leaf380]